MVAAPLDLDWLGSALKDRGVRAGKNPAIVAVAYIDHLREKLKGNPVARPEGFTDEEILASVPKPAPKPSKRQLRFGEAEPYGGGWKRAHLCIMIDGQPAPIWTNR